MGKLPTIRLTVHAQMRMFERSIDINDVKWAVQEPDNMSSDSYGTIKVKKKIRDREIVVIYLEEKYKDKGVEYLVVTFYYLN